MNHIDSRTSIEAGADGPDAMFADEQAADDLALWVPPLPAASRCADAAEMLSRNPDYPALAVVDAEEQVVGLVARNAFMAALAKPYGREVWLKAPVSELMDSAPLVVDSRAEITSIGRRMAEEAPKALTDGFVITQNGKYLGIGTAVDFLRHSVAQAERRTAELDMARMQAIEASIAALEASEAKSAFLANMSHEIRTPLNGVLANLELLKFTDIGAEQHELVASAEIAAQTLLDIIGDVLDFSKIEAGKLEVEMVEMDPARVLNEVATLLRSKAQQTGVRLLALVGPGVPAKIIGDPLRLRQVLTNLAGNSLKFTKTGAVCLRLVRDDDGSDDAQCRLRFEVSDTGIGFPPHIGRRLFEAFEQADGSTTRKFGGTGLGLAICKRLVELMGGDILNDGLPGGGASFWFVLPVQVTAPPPPLPEAALRNAPVLLVVGDRRLRSDLSLALEDFGAWPLPAADAEAALSHLASPRGGTAPRLAIIALETLAAEGAAPAELARRFVGGLPGIVLLPGDDDIRLRRRLLAAGLPLALPRPERADPILPWIIGALAADSPAAAPAAGSGAAPMQMVDLAGLRILVLEDTPMNQQVVRRQLKQLGLGCEIAENGAVGLERALAAEWDLIISDCQMPEMDGFEFTRRWRTHEASLELPRLPIVAMTANATEGDAERCRAAGMDGYVSKPVRIERLAEAIRTAVGARSFPLPAPAPDLEQAPPPAQEPTAQAPVIQAPVTQAPAATDDEPAVDLPEFLALTGIDDTAIVHDLLGFFNESFPELLDNIGIAVMQNDRAGIKSAAHAAKGAARNAAAKPLGDVLEKMERTAESADIETLRSDLDLARSRYRAVDAAISAILEGV